MKNLTLVATLGLAATLILDGQTSAGVITVPNGDFQQLYKPGSTTITADLDQSIVGGGWTQGFGWTQGVGPAAPTDVDPPRGTISRASYSDGTVGYAVDIPGWIGADKQGWIDNGGSYERDTTTGNAQGSVTRQENVNKESPWDMDYYYMANGGNWDNPAGGMIVSDAPLATIESGLTYTLSMLVKRRENGASAATPVVLDLLADGVALTPSSSIAPVLSKEWQVFSRTYDAASLGGRLGEFLTIQLGVGRGAIGSQTHFDDVSLTTVPEPSTLALLCMGAFGLLAYGWRRRKIR